MSSGGRPMRAAIMATAAALVDKRRVPLDRSAAAEGVVLHAGPQAQHLAGPGPCSQQEVRRR